MPNLQQTFMTEPCGPRATAPAVETVLHRGCADRHVAHRLAERAATAAGNLGALKVTFRSGGRP